MPKKRSNNKREIKKRILILCEGEKTEPIYFKGLKNDKSRQNKLAALRIEIYDPKKNKQGKKNTGIELVKQAKDLKEIAENEKNPYDDIWIVIDKDGYTRHPQTFDQANANGIQISFSSISFEFWYLLHFEYTTRSFQKADQLIKYLKNKNYIQNYEKSGDYYEFLKDKTISAINNAKQIRRNYWRNDIDNGKKIYELNPYTNVDILVDNLLNL